LVDKSQMCLDTLKCVLTQSCFDYTGLTGTACWCGVGQDIQMCGANDDGNGNPYPPTGPCVMNEYNGLNLASTSPGAVGTAWGNTTRPAGVANQLSLCLASFSCSTCF
jgi:hypothetical protein